LLTDAVGYTAYVPPTKSMLMKTTIIPLNSVAVIKAACDDVASSWWRHAAVTSRLLLLMLLWRWDDELSESAQHAVTRRLHAFDEHTAPTPVTHCSQLKTALHAHCVALV